MERTISRLLHARLGSAMAAWQGFVEDAFNTEQDAAQAGEVAGLRASGIAPIKLTVTVKHLLQSNTASQPVASI